MTLREVLDAALQQNPDVVLARLDQQRAREQVSIMKDPFTPKVFAGSGAAWTYGFPASIDGNAPSIVQARTIMSLFDRPQSYLIAAANENLRGAGIDLAIRQQTVAFQVASLFLDAQQASRSLAAALRENGNLDRVQQLVGARVEEGRELPIASARARMDVLRGRQRVTQLEVDQANAETSLAVALGMSIDDRVRAAEEDRVPAQMTPEAEAIQQALDNSSEIKRLESNLQAKTLEIKSYNAQRWFKADLVAQYNLLGKYNNFDQYFNRFQRHNVELGASFSIPLLTGRSAKAYATQAEVDVAKLRVEVSRTRGKIASDLKHAYQQIRAADEARDLARADLDLAREQVTLDLAQLDEGRILPARVEQDRAVEEEKWLAYYEAQTASERARLNVLRQSGTLLAAIK